MVSKLTRRIVTAGGAGLAVLALGLGMAAPHEPHQEERHARSRPAAWDGVRGHLLLHPLALDLAFQIYAKVSGGGDWALEEVSIIAGSHSRH